MKKVDPKDESRIEKGASIYSNACRDVNSSPRVTVILSDMVLAFRFDIRMA